VIFNLVSGGVLIGVIYALNRAALGLFLPAHGMALELAVHLNAIVLWSFALFGMSLVLYGVVRATGAVVPPLIMLALALWGIRVPFAYALVDRWQADAIWWSFPVASIASVTMASLYYQFGNWRKVQLGIAQRRDPAECLNRVPAGRGVSPRPLVVRCGAFGDMVLITALIRALHARFGEPVDIVTSGPWSAPLLEGQPGVGEILSVRSRKTPYWLAPDQQRVVRLALARRRTHVVLRRQRGGTADARARRHSGRLHRRREGSSARGGRARDRAMAPARGLEPQGSGSPPPPAAGTVAPGAYLRVTPSQEADLDGWLEARGLAGTPLVLIQAGNKRTMRRGLRRLAVNHKYWPAERWGAVMLYLRARCPGHRIVLLGTGPEYRLNEELIAAARIPDVCNAADDLPIPRLVALLSRAAGLVTVDSGPAHAAAAVGCPLVVLFGRASPTLYRPWGTSGADVKVLTGASTVSRACSASPPPR
jgi:ADP-heptose:LPS heptosyltransferase